MCSEFKMCVNVLCLFFVFHIIIPSTTTHLTPFSFFEKDLLKFLRKQLQRGYFPMMFNLSQCLCTMHVTYMLPSRVSWVFEALQQIKLRLMYVSFCLLRTGNTEVIINSVVRSVFNVDGEL